MLIDFSCKHHILLQDAQGNVQPMDVPYFWHEQVRDQVFHLHTDGDAIYLVIGQKESLVIDSGYGCGDLRAYCQSLSPVPVNCIANTHHHFDHTANNAYFDKAYLSAATAPLATIPFPSFAGIDFPRNYPKEIVADGSVIDLGGKTLEVFETPDHACGSICLLDRADHILFSGDEFIGFGKILNSSVQHWKSCLDKLMPHRGEFDLLCGGCGILDAALLDKQYALVCRVLGGEEGRPPEGNPMAFPETPVDSEGRRIYSRYLPHPEDRPSDLPQPDSHKRVLFDGNVMLMYDTRRIWQ
ncbi:MAG: MBL fold metallo-hydrolase [Firmicutes bacterium]|nr:MBL fold metallo-hydrolase [Bacillota bacterium]